MAQHREDLDEMRVLLWQSIRSTDPEKRAPLFARLESVIEQIAKSDAATPKAGDPVDEIAERRTARGAGSAASRRKSASD